MDYLTYSEELKRQIRVRLNDLCDNLATGCAVDYPSYRAIVGQIQGLAEAESMLIDLRNKFDQEG